MSNSFIGSPCRAFRQSPCRARESSGGAFIFHYLKSGIFAHNSDGVPWGEHAGQNPSVAWPYPLGAQYITPIPAGGAVVEQWGVGFPPFPNDGDNPFNLRGGNPYSSVNNPQVYPRAFRSGFSWITSGTPSHTWTILVAYRQHRNYRAFSSGGISYPGGTYDDIADRFKIYPPASGVATYHTLTDNPLFDQAWYNGFQNPTTIPLPHKTKRRDTGDPVEEFVPDAPSPSEIHFDDVLWVPGTLELCLFWFERTEDDLPIFPYLLDPSTL